MEDTIDQQELQQLKEQVALLTRIADKSKLARLRQDKDLGKSIRVTVYREDELSDPRIVVGWKMIKNYVKTSLGKGIFEDQVIEIYVDSEVDPKKVSVYKMQLGKLEKKIDAGGDLTEEEQLKLESLNTKITQSDVEGVQMTYEDFFKLEKKEVDVIRTITENDGGIKFEIKFNDKKYELDSKFIN